MEKIKSGTIFGNTEKVNNNIKTFYPNAKFVPVCALGCYYNVYSDDSYSTLIAEYNYLSKTQDGNYIDIIPKEARDEFKPFGSFFKLVWK